MLRASPAARRPREERQGVIRGTAAADPAAGAPVIALTGGIATGKSTVAGMLAGLGAAIVDADELARAVVAPRTPGLARVAASFGPGILRDDGSLDRDRLGELIFADTKARRQLEAIIHPEVTELSRERIERALAAGAQLVVYEIPLLFETGREAEFPTSILVYLDPVSQLRRLMARSNLGEAAARARIESQMALDRKRQLATWVVDNSASLASTRDQVEALWKEHLSPARTAPG